MKKKNSVTALILFFGVVGLFIIGMTNEQNKKLADMGKIALPAITLISLGILLIVNKHEETNEQ